MRKWLFGGVSALVSLLLYLRFIRPRQIHWGASAEEIARELPGDDLVQQPDFVATRAVTVSARPEDIWPWLLQIGSKRAGWYSIDWMDNGGTPSAEDILPEYQHVNVGDFVPFTPNGKNGMWVKAFEPAHYLLWWDCVGAASWLWWLEPVDAAHTRLVIRNRVSYDWTFPWIIYYLLFDFGDIVMMSKCMLGIKRRAEQVSAAVSA